MCQRLALKFLRHRWRPCFELVQIRHVESQYHVNAVVATIERQPVFVRHAFGLLDGDVNLDPALVVQLHTPVLAHAVLLQVIGNEETILSVVEGKRPEGLGGGHIICWHANDVIVVGGQRFTVHRQNGWIDSFVRRLTDRTQDRLEKQKVTLTTEVKKAKAAAKNLKKYQDEVAEAQKRFAQTAIVLPKKKEIPNLLRNISDLGKGAGLDFLSFKPGSEIPKDFYAEIPVDISIRGPYHNMGYFLDQVSKLNRIVTVNNIKMASPKKEGGEMLLNSTCRLVTYRFTNTQLTTDKNKKKGKK